MKIIENSNERLQLRFLGRGVSGTMCNFDRQKDQAEIVRLLLFLPFRRERVALSNIAGMEIKKREHNDEVRYSPVIRLHRGKSLAFACRAKDEALEAIRMIRTFLLAE